MWKLTLAAAALFLPVLALAQAPTLPPTSSSAITKLNDEWVGLIGANTALQNALGHAKEAAQALVNENTSLQAQVKDLQDKLKKVQDDLKAAQDQLAAAQHPDTPPPPSTPPPSK
jgi:peptidoglycan hydrolase CwlO-like protein